MPHQSAGVSLLPVLQNPAASVKDAAFTLISRSPDLYAQSVRTSRWRFTRWSDGQKELYDHDADAEELHNVSAQHADVVNDLSEKLKTLPAFKP